MDLFEFVVSFYVVIAGLGVTLLMRSIGQMLESRRRIQFYGVHSWLLFFLFLMHVNSWFTLWAYRDQVSWTVLQLLLLVSVPVLLYLASHVSVPEIAEHSSARHEMRTYYYERHRLLFTLLALPVAITLASEYLLLGEQVFSINNALRLAGLALLCLGAISGNERVHVAIATSLLLIVVGAAAFLGSVISA